MPSKRDIARAQRVREVADILHSLLDSGTTYQRATARLLRQRPDLARGKVLADATATVRQERLVRGIEKRRESLAQTNANRRRDIAAAASAAAAGVAFDRLQYERRGDQFNLTGDTRVEVHFTNPLTQQPQVFAVYLPIPADAEMPQIVARVSAAILSQTDFDDYEHFHAIWTAVKEAASRGAIYFGDVP